MVIFGRCDGYYGCRPGAGGTVSSAFCNKADDSITSFLKSIAGHARFTQELLRIESGIWDTRTRADMLVTRFFTKLCSSDHDSLVWWVVRMSMRICRPQCESVHFKIGRLLTTSAAEPRRRR